MPIMRFALGGREVEAVCLVEMLDRGLGLARERIHPSAAFPAPDERRIERKNPGDECTGVVELPGHRVHAASGGQHQGVVRIEDAGPLAEQQRAGLFFAR